MRTSWIGCAAFVLACNDGTASEGGAGSGESSGSDTTSTQSSSTGDESSAADSSSADSGPGCGDADRDGYLDASCGGDDCDDANADVHPDAPDVAGPPMWAIATIDDENATTGRLTTLALDGDGVPHVAYTAIGGLELRHAIPDDDTWSIDTVDTASSPSYPIESLAIAVASDGALHLSYEGTMGLTHAQHDGAWTLEQVPDPNGPDDIGMDIDGTALAIAGNGDVQLAYGMTGELRIATKSGGTWSSAQVYLCVSACSSPVIAIGPDAIHLAYQDSYQDAVEYAVSTGGWISRPIVDSQAGVPTPRGVALALASDGLVHASLYVEGAQVVHAQGDSSGFTSAPITDVAVGGLSSKETTAIAFDGSGALHVAYRSSGRAAGIFHATNADGTWVTEQIDDGDTGYSCAMGLDAQGDVHLAWQDAELGAVRYAQRSAPDGIDQDCDGVDG
ncbi:MAG TPA: hypothetical protein VG755_43710 [Nannocystaceae bacterium]|nr:hypothetical protein [Nannocystaceae bacterium]